MLSLFPRPDRFTLDTRGYHIAERDRALCYPSTSASSLSDLPSSEIDIKAGDQEILSCGLEELAQAIASSRWTSEEVCLAFIRSSRRAQRAINCITVPNYQAAIARARQLDQHFKETGKTVGIFHGIPFSFKENNNIKGLTTTVGYTAWVLDGPAKEDAALARMVQHLGGVIIVKTNVPQTMMSFECFNPLYDRTLNPWSPAHGPGGSSGGEAALLGADGAVAGFGSDIGGSLRIPSGYCGIYALKPTAGRFPSAGAKSARAGFDGIISVFGPMTRSSADLEFLSRNLIELIHPNVDSPLDPWAAQDRFGCEELRAAPLRPAWLDPIKAASSRDGDHKKIRMGYYFCDGFTQTSPACIRAVQESIEALKASEHADRYEFIEVDPNRLRAKEAMHIFLSNVTADNFNGLLGPLRLGRIKEAMDFALFLPVFSTRAPRWARGLFRWVVQYLVKDPHLSYMLSAGGAKSAEAYMQQIARRKDFEKQFIKDIWKFYQLDGIICPIQASPAIPHGACAKLSALACSTILYNVLDYAVSICPITRVDPELDAVPTAPTAKSTEKPSKAYTSWCSTPGFDTCSKMVSYSLYGEGVYDATKMSGLPVGVQVVTKKFEEEKAIGLMRLLDEANRKRSKHAWGPGQYTEKMYS